MSCWEIERSTKREAKNSKTKKRPQEDKHNEGQPKVRLLQSRFSESVKHMSQTLRSPARVQDYVPSICPWVFLLPTLTPPHSSVHQCEGATLTWPPLHLLGWEPPLHTTSHTLHIPHLAPRQWKCVCFHKASERFPGWRPLHTLAICFCLCKGRKHQLAPLA